MPARSAASGVPSIAASRHSDLSAACPDTTTVSSVAARWGFAHHGRFATAYRRKFGRLPAQTLRDSKN